MRRRYKPIELLELQRQLPSAILVALRIAFFTFYQIYKSPFSLVLSCCLYFQIIMPDDDFS